MEFFERAHVVKKDHNTEDNMKKQLKQMLYGYKQNDNRLIRDAANIENDMEDSTSVSGYSDLNLTASSSEGNTTRQRISFIGSESVRDNISFESVGDNISLDDSNESKSNKSVDSSFDENASLPKTSDVSLSDINEDIESLSEASISLNESDESDHFSMTSTSVSSATDIESSASEPFDCDGQLASKILEKLKLKENPESSKKERKRKLEPEIGSQDSCAMESDYSSVELNSDIEPERHSDSSINYTNVVSPSFVSITALDMPSESLGDILGDYTYPTVRNLPSESQNVFATNKSGIFSTADLDNSKVNTTKAFDSLLPELGSELDISPDVDLESSTDMPVEETSLGYDTSIQPETTFQREASTESVNTNFVNPVNIFFGKKCCILVLKHPAEIYIHGKVRVTSLGGSIEIGGFNLQDKTYDVYAPNYNCAQYLRTLEHENAICGLFAKLTGSGLSVAQTEEIVTTLGAHDSVVQMQPLHDRVAQFVENYCMVTDLFSKTNKNVDGCFRKASDFLGCSLYLMKPWKSFEENSCWSRALQHGYLNQSRGIVCGGKGSGKSSFLRYYVNKLVARSPVLVVDLDPGQSEFTPAGSVSATVASEPLLGPAFTHLKTPERMLNIGLINTMDNPRRYAAAVAEILSYCRAEPRFRDMPWIVNTMGMCNGLGLQFMTLIILLLQPTFVLQIDSKNPKKRFAHYLDPDTVKMLCNKYQNNYLFKSLRVHNELDYALVISSSDSVKSNFSLIPREERYLNFLAYFGSMLNNYNTDDFLLGAVPYEVDLRNLYVAVNVRIDRASVARVINGKIVALCKHSGDSGDKIFTLADTPLRCYGHGLIRGLDVEKGLCYVVTPTPASALAEVDTLVYADWMPELALSEAALARLPRGTALPYRAPDAAPQRQLMSAPRRRYNPVQLLMSRTPKVKASVS